MAEEAPAKVRGVYENPVGSGVWWIQFFANGKRHREKVGRRSAAIALYQKRRTEVREGAKMPESMRASRVIYLRELAHDALDYSKTHKRTSRQDRSYWKSLQPVFGNAPADSISPAQIEEYFKRRTDSQTGHDQPTAFLPIDGFSAWDTEREG